MRLRSFTGRTMSEAMGLVRQDLGPEADHRLDRGRR